MVRCGLRDEPRLPFAFRLEIPVDSTHGFIDLSSHRSTDSAEVLSYAWEQRYLTSLKIDLAERPASGANIGIARIRYTMVVRSHKALGEVRTSSLNVLHTAIDSGWVACDRLARTALRRMRDAR